VKVSAAASRCNPLNPRVTDRLAGYSSAIPRLLSGQLEFILEPQREFVEQVGQAGAVGLFVAQNFDFAIQGGGGIAAQLIDLGGD
jgi:hypothetical protein